jgi:putative flavoprotein involved in K+ transport
MGMKTLDAVIVGAGQAGLGASYFLQQNGCNHIILERGRIGESWLSQRWDSFRLNTPNFMSTLPGLGYEGSEPGGFSGAKELAQYFQRYADHFSLPVRTGETVVAVEQPNKEECEFIVKIKNGGQREETVTCRSIVVASGVLNNPKLPAIHSRMPQNLVQIHTAVYRNATELPPGAIVVAGSGQSGCQIAEELLLAGRTVYLCTSKVGRAPRRYRGRDILEWWIDKKFLDVTYESLQDKAISRAAQPQVSGLGLQGHTVSLQSLAKQGAVILGRLLDVEGNRLILSDEAAAHVSFADAFSRKLKDDVDAYLAQAGILPPPLEADPADMPDPEAGCVSPLRELDLDEAQVGAVIWATGFTPDFSWIHIPTLDETGQPVHQRGISSVQGLYFIGFPWLNSRKSGIIYGIAEDAKSITYSISEQLASL